MISVRTKEALAAAKARGQVLGTPANLTEAARKKGPQAQRALAVDAHRQATALARSLRDQGQSLRRIAGKLTESGFRTLQGKAWHSAQVGRILAREAA